MLTIRKRQDDRGYYYEVEDFRAYARALAERGIESPAARYRVFVSFDQAVAFSLAQGDWEDQIKSFFALGRATDVPCEIVGP